MNSSVLRQLRLTFVENKARKDEVLKEMEHLEYVNKLKEELEMIIQAAGGTMIDHSDLPLSYGKDRSHVIVITSDPPLPEQVGNILGRELAHDGAGFFSTTWLFQCIMQQKLSGIRRGLGKV